MAAWSRQLRFERLQVTREPPASGRHDVIDPLSSGQLQVRVRRDRLSISSHVNPVLEWTIPVFVGRIERTSGQATIDGLTRPSWFGLFVGALPVIGPLCFVAAGRYVSGAIMFGALALLVWSQLFLWRSVGERARVDIAEFLEPSPVSRSHDTTE